MSSSRSTSISISSSNGSDDSISNESSVKPSLPQAPGAFVENVIHDADKPLPLNPAPLLYLRDSNDDVARVSPFGSSNNDDDDSGTTDELPSHLPPAGRVSPTSAELLEAEKQNRLVQSLFFSGKLDEAKDAIDSANFTSTALLVKNEEGRTLLHHLLVLPTVQAIQLVRHIMKSPKCSDEVLQAKSAKDDDSTPLHLALIHPDIPEDIFELMVSKPECSDEVLRAKNRLGNTVLHQAILFRKYNCTRRILTSRACNEELLMSLNSEFNTPLHCAVGLNDFVNLNLLLSAKACGARALSVTNAKHESCLYQAANLESSPLGLSAREFQFVRTSMVQAILKFTGCTKEALACGEQDEKKIMRTVRGLVALRTLKNISTSNEIRRNITLYMLHSELNELERENLDAESSVRDAIYKLTASIRSEKPEEFSTAELTSMVFFIRNTRAFAANPEKNYASYTGQIEKMSKVNRSWGKIYAQLALVVLFACLTAAAIAISLASFGIGTAFVAATIGIVIAHQVTVGTGLAIAGSVAALGLTGTTGFFAVRNIQRSRIAECGAEVQHTIKDFYIDRMVPRVAV